MSREISSVADLFAVSQGTQCHGPDQCHWCGSPCEREFRHDEPEAVRFVKRVSFALRPANCYICEGCWMYRRKNVTVRFLGGGWKDKQTAASYSWLVTPTEVTMLRRDDYQELYKVLLNPPLVFSLAMIDAVTTENHIQYALLNKNCELRADTKLGFTLNNVKHWYTVYDLEQGLKKGSQGLEPGVGALLRFLGDPPAEVIPFKKEEKRPKPGRPPGDKSSEGRIEVRRVITKSG